MAKIDNRTGHIALCKLDFGNFCDFGDVVSVRFLCSCLFFCVSVVRSAAKPRCWSADWTRVAMWNYWVWSKNAVLLPWRSWVARYETGNRFWVFIPLSNCIYLLRSAEHPLGSWSDAACARCCSTVHDMPTLSKVDPPVQEALDLTAFRRCSAENSGS